MELVGTISINVQNKFLKLWYKKKIITLQDIYLTKQEGPKGAPKVLAGKQIVVPNDTLDEEFVVELEDKIIILMSNK
jgi:hypothetical protein